MDYYLRYQKLKEDVLKAQTLQDETDQIDLRKQIAVQEMFIEYDNYLDLEEKETWHVKYNYLLDILNK